MNVGIFGGTFNPVHKGHLIMAEAARKEYKLDCVYFIPCGIPPHKPKETLLPAKLRYVLLKKAVRKKKYFKVLDIEIKKKRKAYTIETIKELVQRKYGVPLLYFLIGQDEFEKLHKWERANELVKFVRFLVLPRLQGRKKKKVRIPKVKGVKWSLVHTKPVNVSGTEMRKKLFKLRMFLSS